MGHSKGSDRAGMDQQRIVGRLDRLVSAGRITSDDAERLRAADSADAFQAIMGEVMARHEIPLGLVQAAISYYGAYREEIDQWIEANEQQAAEAYAAWSAGQDAIRP